MSKKLIKLINFSFDIPSSNLQAKFICNCYISVALKKNYFLLNNISSWCFLSTQAVSWFVTPALFRIGHALFSTEYDVCFKIKWWSILNTDCCSSLLCLSQPPRRHRYTLQTHSVAQHAPGSVLNRLRRQTSTRSCFPHASDVISSNTLTCPDVIQHLKHANCLVSYYFLSCTTFFTFQKHTQIMT